MLLTPAKKLANFSFRVNQENTVLTSQSPSDPGVSIRKIMHIFRTNRTRVRSPKPGPNQAQTLLAAFDSDQLRAVFELDRSKVSSTCSELHCRSRPPLYIYKYNTKYPARRVLPPAMALWHWPLDQPHS